MKYIKILIKNTHDNKMTIFFLVEQKIYEQFFFSKTFTKKT